MRASRLGLCAAVALTSVVGCGSEPPPSAEVAVEAEFFDALESGADCPELFSLRNDAKGSATPEQQERMNEGLRAIECYSSESQRTPGEGTLAHLDEEEQSGHPPNVSKRCMRSMRRAANESDIEKADPLIVASLDACKSAAEWLTALRRHPAAMGLMAAVDVGETDLIAACGSNRRTAVCRDAAQRGQL